jgi:hypothetical protein
MKRATVLGFAFLFAVTSLAAQNSAPASAGQTHAQAATNFGLYLPAPTCPVTMHALQGSGTGLVPVRGEPRVSGASQRLHLVLTSSKSAKIAGAKVKVFGLSGKNRIEQASANPDHTLDLTNQKSTFDLTRTLDVTFTPEGETSIATDLVLPGFTSVSSIQLESLSYKDGSTWAVAGQRACNVAPDPMMLVADR